MPRMPIHIKRSAIGSILLVHLGLQRREIGLDLLARAQFGDLLVERLLRRTQRQRIGATLGHVDAAFGHVKRSESAVWGKRVSVRVELGGRSINKKNKNTHTTKT